jgi:DNA-binding MarR family transcriptional regulator
MPDRETAAESRELLAAALRGSTGTLLRQALTRFMTEAGEQGPQSRDFVVLDALAGQDAASQEDLARRISVNRTIMVRLIDRLQDAGYVTRTRNPANRRTYVLSLTDSGRAALADLRQDVARRNKRITAALTAGERRRLNELLGRLLAEPRQSPVSSTEHLVTQAHYRLRKLGDQALADHGLADDGLRTRHFGVLPALDLLGPCPQQQLARRLALTEATTALLVDELVKSGLVARGQDPHDRRRYALEITGPGRQRIPPMHAAQQQVEAEVASLLGAAGKRELDDILARLASSAGGEDAARH